MTASLSWIAQGSASHFSINFGKLGVPRPWDSVSLSITGSYHFELPVTHEVRFGPAKGGESLRNVIVPSQALFIHERPEDAQAARAEA